MFIDDYYFFNRVRRYFVTVLIQVPFRIDQEAEGYAADRSGKRTGRRKPQAVILSEAKRRLHLFFRCLPLLRETIRTSVH